MNLADSKMLKSCGPRPGLNFPSVSGAPADCIEQLEKLGLVERVGAAPVPAGEERRATVRGLAEPDVQKLDPVARFRMAQQFMNDTAVNALGLKAFFFTLKLEKAATVEELRPLVDDYRKAIAKGSGEEEAAVLTQRLQEMLA